MTSQLSHISFDTLWKMRIVHPYSLLVRDGDLAWSCGQCPLDESGTVVAPDDVLAQTELVSAYIAKILSMADMTAASIGKLVVYHAEPDDAKVEAMVGILSRHLGTGALLMPIRIPHFYYDGMMIEVDVHASAIRKPTIRVEDPAHSLTLEVTDGGALKWARLTVREIPAGTGAPEVSNALRRLISAAGLDGRNLLTEQWFVSPGHASLAAAAAAAGLCGDTGCTVESPLSAGASAVGELTFASSSAPVATTRFPYTGMNDVILTMRANDDFFAISARSQRGDRDLVEQTRCIMAAIERALSQNGLTFDHVRKSTTHYVAGSSEEELHENMAVRNHHYSRPGPASTGLPIAAFPLADCSIVVSIIGHRRISAAL